MLARGYNFYLRSSVQVDILRVSAAKMLSTERENAVELCVRTNERFVTRKERSV